MVIKLTTVEQPREKGGTGAIDAVGGSIKISVGEVQGSVGSITAAPSVGHTRIWLSTVQGRGGVMRRATVKGPQGVRVADTEVTRTAKRTKRRNRTKHGFLGFVGYAANF